MHENTIVGMVLLIGALALVFVGGYHLGRFNLVVDIDSYGCEKVIAVYHGTGGKK